MTETLIVVALWVAFGASHMLLSSRGIRPRIVSAIGAGPFLGLYSLIAFAIFIPLVSYYIGHRHAGPLLWAVPVGAPLLWALYAVNAVAFVMIAAGLMRPSPAMVGAPAREAGGIHLVTRHALLMGLAIWALTHLVLFGFASDVAFFGGFVVFAIVGCWHQDRRKLADGNEAFRAFHEATPFFPFTGPRTMEGIRGIGPIPIVVGIGLAAGLRWAHGPLLY